MKVTGGCYCKALRYEAEGEPLMKAQCHCRECQHITGGSPNVFMAMPIPGFRYTQGAPQQFTRSDLERAVTRAPGFPAVIIKVGSMDDPSLYGGPMLAIYTCDKQAFHRIPEGIATFEKLPG